MPTTIALTETGATLDTSFSAMDNLLSASISSATQIPSGYSRIVNVEFSVATDDVVETCTIMQITGGALVEGDQYILGPAMNTIASSTGAFNGKINQAVDMAVKAGRSITVNLGATASITADAAVVLTLA